MAIPIGVLIVGSVPVDFAVAVPMLGVLTLATVLLFTVLRTELSLSTPESYALLVGYGPFVMWVVAETVGVTPAPWLLNGSMVWFRRAAGVRR